MRIALYILLAVLSGLLVADAVFIHKRHSAPTAVHDVDISSIDLVLSELGRLQMRARYEEALLLAYDARKQHPDSWRLTMAHARTLLAMGQLEGAMRSLNSVVDAQPQNLEARSERARCLRDMHKIDDALKDITVILKADPQNEAGLFLNGTIQYARGQYEDAIVTFTECLKHHPGALSALYNRAQTYAELKQFEKARVDMELFIEQADSETLKRTAQEVLDQWND